MDIQHKDIPEAGLHEVKGASTATAAQILTAKGDGATEFKKLTGASLSGSVSAGVLSVLPNGDFSAAPRVFATIHKTGNSVAQLVGPNSGVILTGGNFQVERTGSYLVNVSTGLTVAGSSIGYPTFRNSTNSVEMFEGLSAIVTLNSGVTYGFVQSALNFTVTQVV